MKNLKKIIYIVLLTMVSSCFFDKKHKNVDSFYTKRIHLDFPVLPLAKPIFVHYDKSYNEWFFEIPEFFKNKLYLENLKEIGIDNVYIYGKTNKKKRNLKNYKEGEFVYANKYNGISISKELSKLEGELQIFSVDSTKTIFIEPERWFVINVSDSITDVFFSKKKYNDYLKGKGISGKMYKIEKYHKQYRETGILPWFPDNIKEKLKK